MDKILDFSHFFLEFLPFQKSKLLHKCNFPIIDIILVMMVEKIDLGSLLFDRYFHQFKIWNILTHELQLIQMGHEKVQL